VVGPGLEVSLPMIVDVDVFCDDESTGNLRDSSTDLCKSMESIKRSAIARLPMCSALHARMIGLCNAHALDVT
jgi:hypothetical protein